jgi:hypothetical protein
MISATITATMTIAKMSPEGLLSEQLEAFGWLLQ